MNKGVRDNGSIPRYLNRLDPIRNTCSASHATTPRSIGPTGGRGGGAWACLALVAVLLLTGCGTIGPGAEGTVAARAAEKAAHEFNVSQSRDADDLGRFLAGMPGKAGSPFAELESTPAWSEHARLSDQAWTTFSTDRLPALSAFAQSELSDLGKPENTLFYSFSGPDALTATAFFPRVSTYFLVALEPPGTLTGVSKFLKKDLGAELTELRTTFDSLLRRSFFVTRQMDHQLRGQVTDGVLPLVLVELVRGGNTVLGTEFVWIDEEGRMVVRPAAQKMHNWGFVLDFRNDSDGSMHQLYYFSVNLASDHLDKNPEFLKEMASLGPVVSYLKSTSYMLHHPEFGTIRDKIVSMSSAVLQDDSGVPFHFFPPDQWKVQLYGVYQRPYSPFSFMAEKDLRAAFEQPENVKKLDFRIGYGYGRAPSNLELQRRKQPPTP